MEIDAHHSSGAKILEVAPLILGNMCIPDLYYSWLQFPRM